MGIEDYVVEEGRITSLTWTATEEAWKDFYAFTNKVLMGLAALGLVVVGALWWL